VQAAERNATRSTCVLMSVVRIKLKLLAFIYPFMLD